MQTRLPAKTFLFPVLGMEIWRALGNVVASIGVLFGKLSALYIRLYCCVTTNIYTNYAVI